MAAIVRQSQRTKHSGDGRVQSSESPGAARSRRTPRDDTSPLDAQPPDFWAAPAQCFASWPRLSGRTSRSGQNLPGPVPEPPQAKKTSSQSMMNIYRSLFDLIVGDSSGWLGLPPARTPRMRARRTSSSSAWRSPATCFATRNRPRKRCSAPEVHRVRQRHSPIWSRSSHWPIAVLMTSRSKVCGKRLRNEKSWHRTEAPEPSFRPAKSWRSATRIISG